MAAPSLHAGWPALSEVIATLDAAVLHVVQAPGEASASVNDVVILDAADARPVGEGAIVLGVGVGEGDALALADRAGRQGAAAIVLRTDEALSPALRSIASECGLALLTVPPEMPWGQAYSLLRTAVAGAGARGDADTAGVAVGDLFALADAIAAAVGGPVTIEDPHWRVLAFSNLGHEIDEVRRQTILGREPPVEWRERIERASVGESLRAGGRAVRFGGTGLATRLVAPVHAGGELLGSVWVAEAGTAFDEETEAALLRAAELAAIHLIGHRTSEDVDRRTRGAAVRELLEGRVPHAAAGVPPAAGPFTVVGFALSGEGQATAARPDRVLSVISLFCEDFHRDALCALLDDRFWALLPTPPGPGGTAAAELAGRIVQRVERAVGVELLAGVGMPVDDVASVPRSHHAAQQALAVLGRRKDGRRVADIEEVRAQAVVLELLAAAEQHPEWLVGKLERLLAHDRQHATDYVHTLSAYLDCWGDAGETARRLDLHPNTLRYRVRRLVELSGLDLDDPDERLVTQLQLRVRCPR